MDLRSIEAATHSQLLRLRTRLGRPPRVRPFHRSCPRRWLLVSLNDPICQSQIYPFHFFRRELARDHGVSVRELSLAQFLDGQNLPGATAVLFQCWIDKGPAAIRDLAARIRDGHPGAQVGFLDPFAPTDLRYAEALDPIVDIYIKKHVLRDRSEYGKPTLGDTNLSDWYGRRYAEDLPVVTHRIPADFMDKLVVGPSFLTSPLLISSLWARDRPKFVSNQMNRLHARLGGAGPTGWYSRMRAEATTAAKSVKSVDVTPSTPVSRREYFKELRASSLCFSPFGYGEVCWRDYEAVVSGSTLIKPDMSHVETYPNIFIPHETYVPIRWDFADLDDAVAGCASQPKTRLRIAEAAYRELATYVRSGSFVETMAAHLT